MQEILIPPSIRYLQYVRNRYLVDGQYRSVYYAWFMKRNELYLTYDIFFLQKSKQSSSHHRVVQATARCPLFLLGQHSSASTGSAFYRKMVLGLCKFRVVEIPLAGSNTTSTSLSSRSEFGKREEQKLSSSSSLLPTFTLPQTIKHIYFICFHWL